MQIGLAHAGRDDPHQHLIGAGRRQVERLQFKGCGTCGHDGCGDLHGHGSLLLRRDQRALQPTAGNGKAPDDDAFLALGWLAAGLSMQLGRPLAGDERVHRDSHGAGNCLTLTVELVELAPQPPVGCRSRHRAMGARRGAGLRARQCECPDAQPQHVAAEPRSERQRRSSTWRHAKARRRPSGRSHRCRCGRARAREHIPSHVFCSRHADATTG
jgi:hypothetical protein